MRWYRLSRKSKVKNDPKIDDLVEDYYDEYGYLMYPRKKRKKRKISKISNTPQDARDYATTHDRNRRMRSKIRYDVNKYLKSTGDFRPEEAQQLTRELFENWKETGDYRPPSGPWTPTRPQIPATTELATPPETGYDPTVPVSKEQASLLLATMANEMFPSLFHPGESIDSAVDEIWIAWRQRLNELMKPVLDVYKQTLPPELFQKLLDSTASGADKATYRVIMEIDAYTDRAGLPQLPRLPSWWIKPSSSGNMGKRVLSEYLQKAFGLLEPYSKTKPPTWVPRQTSLVPGV